MPSSMPTLTQILSIPLSKFDTVKCIRLFFFASCFVKAKAFCSTFPLKIPLSMFIVFAFSFNFSRREVKALQILYHFYIHKAAHVTNLNFYCRPTICMYNVWARTRILLGVSVIYIFVIVPPIFTGAFESHSNASVYK